MTPPLRCLREQVSEATARRIVEQASGCTVHVERTLYYPYLWYRARYRLATLFGRPRFETDCLVDARKGVVSTADGFETRELRPPPDDVLGVCVDRTAAAAAAQRTLSHALSRQHRSGAPLELETDTAGTLYKRFWVMRCGEAGPRVLLDSTTGRFTVLTPTGA